MVVGHGSAVLTSIELDDQIVFATSEVGDVAANGDLPGELVAIKPSVAQSTPELALGVSHVSAEAASSSNRALSVCGRPPHPVLLPQGRRDAFTKLRVWSRLELRARGSIAPSPLGERVG
jgi:hypothetical protein